VAPRGAHLVVSNPPYLATPLLRTLPVEVRDWEPRAALDGGPDGLDVVRRLVAAAPAWLRPGGTLLVETDGRYAEACVHRDFRGCERLLEARGR
jgi:release factor glutamine methyltransferase